MIGETGISAYSALTAASFTATQITDIEGWFDNLLSWAETEGTGIPRLVLEHRYDAGADHGLHGDADDRLRRHVSGPPGEVLKRREAPGRRVGALEPKW